MHMQYMRALIEKGTDEGMEVLGKVFDKAMSHMKKCDPEYYKKLEMKLYEAVNGKVINEEMAEEWIMKMKPRAKWTMEETNSVRDTYKISDISQLDFYIVMNMLYSDMKNLLGSGEDEESLKKYVEATKDWLSDEDVGKDKLYNYYKYVVMRK